MIDKILSFILKQPFFCEAIINEGKYSNITLKDNNLSINEKEISGIGIRVITNGSSGYAWSTNLNDYEFLIKEAASLAKLGKKSLKRKINQNLKFEDQKNDKRGKIYSIPSTEERVNLLKEIEKNSQDRRITNTNLNLIDRHLTQTYINSFNVIIEERSSHSYFSAVYISKEGNNIQRGMERAASREGYKNFNLYETAEKAKESAIRMLKAEKPTGGIYTVILDPEMCGVFVHEVVGHAAEADLVMEGESILANKIGTKLANEDVTIYDDPEANFFGQYFYDNEGIRGKKVTIIENGILKNYLHSRETANFFKAYPNGHARAESFKHLPLVRMSNTFLKPGSYSENEIFSVSEGIYVKGMKGGSVDTFSGEFMFAAREAWLVKNGSLEKILRDITISGNILETLNSIEAIGKDFKATPGFCGKHAQSIPVSDGGPHIRVKNLKVG